LLHPPSSAETSLVFDIEGGEGGATRQDERPGCTDEISHREGLPDPAIELVTAVESGGAIGGGGEGDGQRGAAPPPDAVIVPIFAAAASLATDDDGSGSAAGAPLPTMAVAGDVRPPVPRPSSGAAVGATAVVAAAAAAATAEAAEATANDRNWRSLARSRCF